MPWRKHKHMRHFKHELHMPVPIWHWPEGDAALLVGTWKHARDRVPASWDFSVNCADYPVECWVKIVVMFWLNINFCGAQGETSSPGVPDPGRTDWFKRMWTALDTAAYAILSGQDVLFYCSKGKHKSGALAALFLALVLGIDSEEARNMYYDKRGLNKPNDHRLVKWLWDNLDLDSFIEKIPWSKEVPHLAKLREAVQGGGRGVQGSSSSPGRRSSNPRLRSKRSSSPGRRSSSPRRRSKGSRGSESSSPGWRRSRRCRKSMPSSAGVQGVPAVQESKAGAQRSRSPRRGARRSGSSESRNPGVQLKLKPKAKPRPKAKPKPRLRPPPRPRSRSRCRSSRSESSASTANSVVLGTRTNRIDVPVQGAWTCEQCKQLVAKWELYCTSWHCGKRRPLLTTWREGDWICWACGNHNYSFRRTCEFRDCPGKVVKKWDWFCPKCGNHNYARRQVCNSKKCGHPRPEP